MHYVYHQIATRSCDVTETINIKTHQAKWEFVSVINTFVSTIGVSTTYLLFRSLK